MRHGRLAGTTVSPLGADPWPYVAALRASAEVVEPPVLPLPAALPAETEKVLGWLESDGVRLVAVTGVWTSPVHGAGGERARLEPLAGGFHSVAPFDEPTGPGLVHRPSAVAG